MSIRNTYSQRISNAIEAVNFENREYQCYAVKQVLKELKSNNVELNLPPGTGKTLISQIVASEWLECRKDEKCLCILPSSVLLDQHYNFCCFWAKYQNLLSPLKIDSEWIRRKGVPHTNYFNHMNMWFSLPELLSNNLEKNIIPRQSLKRISLIIIDEYDSFSLGILRSEGVSTSFNKPFLSLLKKLEDINCRYFLLSATPEK